MQPYWPADPADLERIEKFYGNDPSGKPLLLTGFNRRFSPAATATLADSSTVTATSSITLGIGNPDHLTFTQIPTAAANRTASRESPASAAASEARARRRDTIILVPPIRSLAYRPAKAVPLE